MNVMNSFSLSGRRALVTGATRGIGLALATALAQAGASVIVTGRSSDTVDRAVAELQAQGFSAEGHVLDVTRTDDIQRCLAEMGDIDILINNAGTEQICPSLDADEALWDTIIATNLKGAFFCAQAAARSMTRREGGTIINLCSLTSAVGVPGATAYGSSKSGLTGMTRALSTEWAPLGIRVNGIAPGYFETEMTQAFYQDAAWVKSMQAKIPLGRFGELEDLAGAVVFLCSPAARYITGQILYVDGGYLAAI
ncbi:glucose 1-dehydrogenase [Erwinia sp. S43]|uniref:SDR family NAD(P)-dependent oxidoreductase n=1 Tax=unclassified Erwinia TaxID=2622719 RepID=UPI00190E5BA7|nr:MULTISPECIES: glucose 1-dehydrogenase [unclassified Erwinia]MBK0034051.1 glucose 1-dehydrogenase [Erwinia sp. S43]MCW1873277.1 glucose 1-dehydrogenase [Erwinia sp. INIA01]